MKQHTELTERIGFRNKRPDEQTDRRGELTAFGIVRRERRASEAPGSVTDASVRAMRSRFLRWWKSCHTISTTVIAIQRRCTARRRRRRMSRRRFRVSWPIDSSS